MAAGECYLSLSSSLSSLLKVIIAGVIEIRVIWGEHGGHTYKNNKHHFKISNNLQSTFLFTGPDRDPARESARAQTQSQVHH